MSLFACKTGRAGGSKAWRQVWGGVRWESDIDGHASCGAVEEEKTGMPDTKGRGKWRLPVGALSQSVCTALRPHTCPLHLLILPSLLMLT